ncbi:glycosyltransferase [Mycolicibacterium sp. BiH015]|uniref:glycosyltransferase n=1 Tax=Mycolicibacterium sp. BiH015 TaxID=3018808 RepID=UPI0022DECC9E|nr:glycosyltransferase [Mycolicibacterium sp. BiH015]MDA2893820.1 glycosyltransferase [Mycolicibacterium sp. BiH015]
MTVTHLLVGPRPHGVVRFGWDLHRRMRTDGFDVCRQWTAHHGSVSLPLRADAVHLQFTDRLFGDSPEVAAENVASLAAAARGKVTVTLHDVPQPSDGKNFARRTEAYAAVSAACHGVVVSSHHERELLRDCGIEPSRLTVIPLPIDPLTCAPAARACGRTVGVFGYIYPGKGHAEVLAALPAGAEMLAIGETSRGHDDVAIDLQHSARRRGVTFRVTGYIADSEVPAMLQRVSVPVVAHRHISASGSINSWLSAGRRPLAPEHRYTSEFEERNPGSLTLYPDTAAGLRSAIEYALATPESTWLTAGTVLSPTGADVARHYWSFFAECRR